MDPHTQSLILINHLATTILAAWLKSILLYITQIQVNL